LARVRLSVAVFSFKAWIASWILTPGIGLVGRFASTESLDQKFARIGTARDWRLSLLNHPIGTKPTPH
jgi:hypothetical protein